MERPESPTSASPTGDVAPSPATSPTPSDLQAPEGDGRKKKPRKKRKALPGEEGADATSEGPGRKPGFKKTKKRKVRNKIPFLRFLIVAESNESCPDFTRPGLPSDWLLGSAFMLGYGYCCSSD